VNRRRFLGHLALLGGWLAGGCATSSAPGKASRATVVVVGGGYGGATAARYLRRLDPSLQVYLVDPSEPYLSCPGSNDVIAGWQTMDSLQRSHGALQQQGLNWIQDSAAALDLEKRRVRLAHGADLAYDRLILSPGIDLRWDAVPGYDEAASRVIPHAWKAGEQTELLRRQLQAMPDNGTVLISVPANPYRCPPGPYERASLIAHYLQRHKPRAKLLILDGKTQFSKQPLFQEAWRRHYPGLIEWLPYSKTGKLERLDSTSRTLHTEFEAFRADVLNLIPPQQAGALARQAGLSDAGGWCPVRPDTFASSLAEHVHIIGDACGASPMPKSAFSANSQAKICALAVVAELQGRPAPSPALINTCYSLVTPDEAISVAGVYKLQNGQLTQVSGGETALDADWRREAYYARQWRETVRQDSFGG
jgi:sulfide dehydrogenase [flavocytochrome c] flavoprotein subunit